MMRSRRALPGGRFTVGTAVATAVLLAAAPALASPENGQGNGNGHGNGKGGKPASNVILLIGDGMGDSELTAARYYEYGAAGRLAMDGMPERSAVTTWSVQEENPAAPDYVPDSASTATAWSTGSKTSDGRISTTAGGDEDLPTTMELAKKARMRVGNVTTAELTDATPAAPMAHVSDRGCQGPADVAACPKDDVAAGGPGSIAEQSVALGVDVLLGGGAQRYDQPTSGGSTVAADAAAAGYTVVRTAGQLDAVGSGPVLGVFSAGTMPTERTGPLAVQGGGSTGECTANPAFSADVPTLTTMTQRALDLLDSGRGNGRANGRPGFFLQVEGASIDKQNHAANPCAQIGETVAFDRAVQVALDYAKAQGNTTVIVSADHSHTSQILEADDDDSPGATATLTTADGQEIQLNYGTSAPETAAVRTSQDHTGANVPYFGYGPGAEDVPALLDQTDLFGLITGSFGRR